MRRRPEELPAAAAENARNCLAAVDAALAGRAFLMGGDFTAADVMMGYSLTLLERAQLLDTDQHPHAAAYFGRLQARAAYKRAASA